MKRRPSSVSPGFSATRICFRASQLRPVPSLLRSGCCATHRCCSERSQRSQEQLSLQGLALQLQQSKSSSGFHLPQVVRRYHPLFLGFELVLVYWQEQRPVLRNIGGASEQERDGPEGHRPIRSRLGARGRGLHEFAGEIHGPCSGQNS